MAQSSNSQNHSKKTHPFHFQATFETEDIQLVAKIRILHQQNIVLDQESPEKKQTKDLKCATHILSEKFRNMSEEKKTMVRNLGFGGLMHIPLLRVHHQVLRELANNLKLGENRLETGYGSFKITPKRIGDALGIKASGDLFPTKFNYKKLSEDNKEIFRRFQGKTLKSLTDEMMDIGVGNEQDHLMFKRIFILYIQMAFLLPTTINKISPVHLTPIFEMDTITERNWGGHVLNFIIKGVTDYKEKKKKVIDGCLFALMIIYFHLSTNKDKKRAERPPKPWIVNWSKEQLVERMKSEIEENMTETTDSDSSTSDSETQQDSEDSPRKQLSKIGKKIDTNKRKKSHEDSDVESESTDETQSKKKKVVVEHSSPEEDQSYHGSEIGSEDLDEFLRENNENSAAQGEKEADLRSTEGHYVSSETIPDVNLGSDDPSSQGHTTQSSVNRPADSIMSLVEDSHSKPVDLNMIVVRKETPSEALAINPAPDDAAALMMMARTASYVPKKDPLPSFSLDFTDSSQEETTTQEGASTQDEHVAKTPKTPTLLEQLENLVHKIASGGVTKEEKSPQVPKESAAESFEKFETPVRPNLDTTDMKQKCYHWAIRVKSYSNEQTNEFDDIGRLQVGDIYTLSKFHLTSLAPKTHIETENMAIVNYPKGVFLNAKTNRSFRMEDYPMFIPFLDLKKLASHRYGYVISRLKVYAGGAPLKSKDKDREIVAPYLHISGQKTSYDCAIYVMKWLEIFDPTNIKRQKYEWENWSQDKVDHFRVEYASRILFHDMNLDKHEAIRGSNAIRLSKPSTLLLSPYCQIDSEDVDTAYCNRFSGCLHCLM
ncbi:hypothetical protein Ahy_A10g047816 [Arachis hypogaea]|uniref:Ubiquitin-like protease family profile domain-containing protein n=1 Tax=Arachis hypogaea TaxID=3818 RepID=A0A445B3J1_ARAHY|nr:hypothetical protein Ahy_A10g047816 [Arachis hypogaea]